MFFNFLFSLQQIPQKLLNGKKGTVTVTVNKPDNHGAIALQKENSQHFYYEDGTPYFLLAFECDWLYALDYHSEKGIPKTDHLLNLLNENETHIHTSPIYKTNFFFWVYAHLKAPQLIRKEIINIYPYSGELVFKENKYKKK